MKLFLMFLMCLVFLVSSKSLLAETPPAEITAPSLAPREEFLTTLNFNIHEESPELLDRARNLVIDQFSTSMGLQTLLMNRGYQVATRGNEIVLSVVSQDDLRDPMQTAVSSMIAQLNGRIQTRGGARFYRTALSQPTSGALEVVTDDSHSKIVEITAQSVPLRDLLKELKNQVGEFSYLIPGECSERFVEWNFGSPLAEPKSVDIALEELATLFGLRLAKQSGTFIFTGVCSAPLSAQPIRTDFVNRFTGNGSRKHIYFPMPLID